MITAGHEAASARPTGENSLLSALVVARRETAGAGNRRALFGRFDALLDPAYVEPDTPIVAPGPQGGEGVELRRLALRNWRSFEDAELRLPATRQDRNLIVVDAPNGFGKSSVLEALALGLFGRAAVTELGIAQDTSAGRAERRRSYRATMEGTLHRSERARTEGVCAVTLDFSTLRGAVSVERRWYFEEDGTLIEDDEELLVRVGEERHLAQPPDGQDPGEWNQQEVERLVMPTALAPFFLFDGERLERLADGQLSDRVRSALRRLLGLDELAGLIEDLLAYARDRDRAAGENVLEPDVEGEMGRLEAERRIEQAALDEVEHELGQLRARRSEAMAELSGYGGGSHADMRDVLERRHRLEQELRVAQRSLSAAVVEDGPYLLAGRALRSSVAALLASNADYAALQSIDSSIVERLWRAFSDVEPPLDPATADSARVRLEAAALALSTEVEGADLVVDAATARLASAKLAAIEQRGASAIEGALHALALVRTALEALDAEESNRRGADERRSFLKNELAELAQAIEARETARGGAMRQIRELAARIEPMRDAVERRAAALRGAEPRIRRAAAARALAGGISGQLDQLAQDEHGRFAEAVTTAYALLAHKGDVRRVQIGDDGGVSIFDGADRNVTAFRRSAGESQLFAMALIAAVGSVVGHRLPLVVDTPLARLDTIHRRNLLRMFSARPAQTILLTQPEEMTAAHREEINPFMAAALWIDHRLDDKSGVGVSSFASEPIDEMVR